MMLTLLILIAMAARAPPMEWTDQTVGRPRDAEQDWRQTQPPAIGAGMEHGDSLNCREQRIAPGHFQEG